MYAINFISYIFCEILTLLISFKIKLYNFFYTILFFSNISTDKSKISKINRLLSISHVYTCEN